MKTKRKTQGGQALWVIAGMNFGGGSSGSKRSASSSPFQQQHSSGPHHCETASVHYHLPAERQPNLFDPMNGPSAHTIISWLPRLSKSRQLTCQKGKASSLQQSLRFLFTLVLAAYTTHLAQPVNTYIRRVQEITYVMESPTAEVGRHQHGETGAKR